MGQECELDPCPRRNPVLCYRFILPRVAIAMTLTSSSSEPVKAERLMTRLVDRVFGHDFFLSYSRADGMHLPQRLKERLEQAGFRVFLDQTESPAPTCGARRGDRC
jgi:hypothetical protein